MLLKMPCVNWTFWGSYFVYFRVKRIMFVKFLTYFSQIHPLSVSSSNLSLIHFFQTRPLFSNSSLITFFPNVSLISYFSVLVHPLSLYYAIHPLSFFSMNPLSHIYFFIPYTLLFNFPHIYLLYLKVVSSHTPQQIVVTILKMNLYLIRFTTK